MKHKLINSQLSNWMTYQMYLRQFLTLAENVFIYDNMPDYIDTAYLNKTLVRQGAIAFFYDDVLEKVLALPYTNIGSLDVYNRPKKIQVYGRNGYTNTLKEGEFVIMYDNNGRYPIYIDVLQYAERYANVTRTIDINIAQQKTPRIWKTSTEKEKTVKDLANEVDGNIEKIVTYDNINLDDIELVLAPAPFVTDKLQDQKDKIWSEFLRLIGISNLSFQKKERNISDEIQAMQGGTIASRYERFEPRKKAIEEINKKFNLQIKVEYYDGIPTDKKENNEDLEDEEYDI